MAEFRMRLLGMLRTAVVNAIERRDQVYGRQLASLLERYSLILRGYFGGVPKWAVHQDTAIALKRKATK